MLPPSGGINPNRKDVMETIEETIKHTLDAYDLPYEANAIVDQVLAALLAREHQIAETLFNAATAQGLDPNVVRSEMEQAGIQFRTPAVDPDEGTRGQARAAVHELEQLAAEQRASADAIDRQVAEAKRMFGI